MQALLRAWSASRPAADVANPATMLDQAALAWFAALNKSLLDPLDHARFRERVRDSTRQMRTLAEDIASRAETARIDVAPLRRALATGARFGLLDSSVAPMLFARD